MSTIFQHNGTRPNYSVSRAAATTRMIAERDGLRAILAEQAKSMGQTPGLWTDGDMAAESQIRDVEYSRFDALNQRIRQINQALERITTGSYGSCVQCGGKIGHKRLDSDPTVALCFGCQSAREIPRQRLSW